jgi:hypothetical protein
MHCPVTRWQGAPAQVQEPEQFTPNVPEGHSAEGSGRGRRPGCWKPLNSLPRQSLPHTTCPTSVGLPSPEALPLGFLAAVLPPAQAPAPAPAGSAEYNQRPRKTRRGHRNRQGTGKVSFWDTEKKRQGWGPPEGKAACQAEAMDIQDPGELPGAVSNLAPLPAPQLSTQGISHVRSTRAHQSSLSPSPPSRTPSP